jgi:hypothetical protein
MMKEKAGTFAGRIIINHLMNNLIRMQPDETPDFVVGYGANGNSRNEEIGFPSLPEPPCWLLTGLLARKRCRRRSRSGAS